MVVMIPQEVKPTYQFQRRRCGKASCLRCKQGPGHGPYWYAYWRGTDGKLRSTYIGKALPPRCDALPTCLTPAGKASSAWCRGTETILKAQKDLRSTCCLYVRREGI